MKILDPYRLENILWTISGEYERKAPSTLIETDLYFLGLLGLSQREDSYEILTFLLEEMAKEKPQGQDPYGKKENQIKAENKHLLAELSYLLDCIYKDKLLKERPGIYAKRKAYLESLPKLEIKKPKDFDQALEYFLQSLQSLGRQTEDREYIKDFKDKKKKRKNFSSREQQFLNLYDLEKYTLGSAEFTEHLLGDESLENADALTKAEKIRKKSVEDKFGKSAYPSSLIGKIEQAISSGIHQNIKLHFTKNDYPQSPKGEYSKEKLEKTKNVNKNYYEKNKIAINRQARFLCDLIKNLLIKQVDDDIERKNSGKVIPSKIWRSKLGETKLFIKDIKKDHTSYKITLILDSSASLKEKEAQIASSAYIIAKAISMAQIPVRVLGFKNFFNYQIVDVLKDFDQNGLDKIFSYQALGANRDGYAIKAIKEITDPSCKNIFIVLSDASPNDEMNIALLENNAKAYTEKIAVEDTAKEVLRARLTGIQVLGVYAGKEKDLPKEKYIFGQDFAYIKNIENFHKIVGNFFKQVFANKA